MNTITLDGLRVELNPEPLGNCVHLARVWRKSIGVELHWTSSSLGPYPRECRTLPPRPICADCKSSVINTAISRNPLLGLQYSEKGMTGRQTQ